jgi:hypothetical protein
MYSNQRDQIRQDVVNAYYNDAAKQSQYSGRRTAGGIEE